MKCVCCGSERILANLIRSASGELVCPEDVYKQNEERMKNPKPVPPKPLVPEHGLVVQTLYTSERKR